MNLSTFLFSFKGRTGRQQWWVYLLLSAFPIAILDSAWERVDSYPPLLVALLLFVSIVPVWCYLAVGAQRLHDCDMSAWLLLLLFLPYIGALALFIIHGFVPGTQGPNRFGEPSGVTQPVEDRP